MFVKNLKLLCLLASLQVRYVQTRTSAQMQLKSDLDHRSRYHDSCTLMKHYNQHMHNYTNPRNITEMHNALLLTVHLGILKEIAIPHLPEGKGLLFQHVYKSAGFKCLFILLHA